jgi:hypothetical protein
MHHNHHTPEFLFCFGESPDPIYMGFTSSEVIFSPLFPSPLDWKLGAHLGIGLETSLLAFRGSCCWIESFVLILYLEGLRAEE